MDDFPMLRDDFLIDNLYQFTCFPNPSDAGLSIVMEIDWPRPYDLYIYNVLCQFVYHQGGSIIAEEAIPVNADLAAGVYLLRIGTCVRRWVKY